VLVLGVACSSTAAPPPAPIPVVPDPVQPDVAAASVPLKQPLLPPQFAMLAGLMPLRSTGAEAFRATNPTYDGRGIVIAILDSGVDAGVPGLRRTSTGEVKLLDLRDFSDEGRIELSPLPTSSGDAVVVDGTALTGFGRIRRLSRGPFYGGTFAERPLGAMPGSDVNGDGDRDDRFPLVVARASDGWFLTSDTDGDGSLADERAVRDYAVAGETFAYGPLTIAVNLTEAAGGHPDLALFFDNSGHGTHVAGIAAGHEMFGLDGFDGVAPGAQLLGLKISNNARGGISVTGAMARAMEYAARYADDRGLTLVLNLSFGIGNGVEGHATIDSIIDAFAVDHPDILFVISAGNDGPGISTIDFPGSSEFAVSVCALFPGVFAQPPEPGVRPAADVLGWWSGRGGEIRKPDLCAPGVAFSNVPPWNTGEEVSGGTSMAAPQVSGGAALLLSGLLQSGGQRARAVELRHAMVATAAPLAGATLLDQGTGVLDIPAAFRWLKASHRAGRYRVRALPDGGNASTANAAYRRAGLISAADTVQRFVVETVGGQAFALLQLRADAPWLEAPSSIAFAGEPVTVAVTYDARQLQVPGLHVGTVWATPVSDTAGGAAFGLTSTIVVPRALDRPFRERRFVPAGGAERYYFAVGEDAGGLDFSIAVADSEREVTLYLFEPSGQPYRDFGVVSVGGDLPARGSLMVRAEDLTPGVWEAVVVAPPLDGATYTLGAETPVVMIGEYAGHAIAVTTRGSQALKAEVSTEVIGVVGRFPMTVPSSGPNRMPLEAPPWAAEVVIELRIDDALWRRFTDFGVTLWDADGALVGQNPLSYAVGRQMFSLDGLLNRSLELELSPAFAEPDPVGGWFAEVRITFLAREALGRVVAPVTIEPGAGRAVAGGLPELFPELPDGFGYLVQTSVMVDGATAAQRRHVVKLATGSGR